MVPASKVSDGEPVALPITLTLSNTPPSAIEPPDHCTAAVSLRASIALSTQLLPDKLLSHIVPWYTDGAPLDCINPNPVVKSDTAGDPPFPQFDPEPKYPEVE